MAQVIAFALFIVAALAVIFASHFFIYFTIYHFFSVVNPQINRTIVITITILALSFIVASFLAHWRENLFTRGFYFASGVWIGLVVNLLVVFVLTWLVIGLCKAFGISVNQAILGTSAIILAVCYAGWGIWSAFHPVIKEIEVKINNLSSSWQGKTIVQISDVHLGHVFGQKFLQKIVDRINEVNPEAVFITGDLFDGMDGKLNVHIEPLNDIKSAQGIFFVTGNHEKYFGLDKARAILDKTNVQVLDDQMMVLNGLQIIGLNYSDALEGRHLAEAINGLENYNKELPAVLLYHSPVQIEQIKETGIDLQLSGHTHSGQIFPFGWVTKLIFNGYDYGLHQDGNYSLYTSSGVGAWGPTMRTGVRPEIVVIKLK